MRTAVVRIGVDPNGELTGAQLTDGLAELARLAVQSGAELIDNNLANLAMLPPSRREVEILMTGADPAVLQRTALCWCDTAFPTQPVLGVLTFISHGTDDDAHGVLAGFGLQGKVERTATDEGWDIVRVTLKRSDLQRIPESRVHTALEASLNCEVHILTV